MSALTTLGEMLSYSTGIRSSLKYRPISTLSAVYNSEDTFCMGISTSCRLGEYPNSHRKLSSTAQAKIRANHIAIAAKRNRRFLISRNIGLNLEKLSRKKALLLGVRRGPKAGSPLQAKASQRIAFCRKS